MNLLSGDVKRIAFSRPTPEGSERFPIRRIKPLMEIPEAEIALFAYLKGIPFQATTCPYAHESIRSRAREILNQLEAEHPGIKYNLLKSYLEVSKSLKPRGKEENLCTICNHPSSNQICTACTILTHINKQNSHIIPPN